MVSAVVQIIASVLVALAGLGVSALRSALPWSLQGFLAGLSERVAALSPPADGPLEERLTQSTLEDRAVRVAELLKESGNVLDELTAEMTARAATLEQLRADAEHAQQVAEIHKEQQEAVADLLRIELERQKEQLRAEMAKQGRRSFWQGLAVNIGVGLLFFIAGVLATVGLSGQT